jgi:hypothetical protein
MYIINFGTHSSAHIGMKINGAYGKLWHNGGGNGYGAATFRLERGQTIEFEGGWSHGNAESYLPLINIYKA